MRKHV